MCRLKSIIYTCPVLCTNSVEAYETHCAHTGRDNILGECGRVDFGGIEQMRYPCPQHSGFNGTSVPNSMNMWQYVPNNAGTMGLNQLRSGWLQNRKFV